jgi:hypothetical protein
LQKLEKKFLWNPIFGRGPGEFWENPIGLLQKSSFFDAKSDYCKKNLQTFSQCPPLHPHGVVGSNPVF